MSKPQKLTDDDVFKAWEMISPAGHSVLTKGQVLDSLASFFPNISAREVKALVGPGNLSSDKLRALLINPEAPLESDPNSEAFRIIDPQGTGYIDMSVLKKLLLQMPGIDAMDEKDEEFITKLVDADEDGKISLQDFAQIGSWSPVNDMPTEAIRKFMAQRQARLEQERR